MPGLSEKNTVHALCNVILPMSLVLFLKASDLVFPRKNPTTSAPQGFQASNSDAGHVM